MVLNRIKSSEKLISVVGQDDLDNHEIPFSQQAISESLNQTVNMANEDGVTCLHVASLHGYERIAALLLTRGGASPNCRTKVNLKTPLHFACQYNRPEVITVFSLPGVCRNRLFIFGRS